MELGFGAPKNEIILASVFGFLTAEGEEEGRLLAFRFRDPLIGEDIAMISW